MLESTSVLLKRLDNKDLALEPTQKVPVDQATREKAPARGKAGGKPQARTDKTAAPSASRRHPALQRERRREGGGGGGFDPYNSR